MSEIRLIQGDCLEKMKDIPDGSIDLTVTSPPYDNLRSYNGNNKLWGEHVWKAAIKDLYRVTKDGGVVVWVVGDATVKGSETGTSFKQAIWAMECGFNLHDTMIFRKRNPIPQIYRKRYNNEFEYMFVFSKGPVKTHNPIMVDCLHAGLELGSTTYKNYSKGEQVRKKIANPVKKQKIKGNIWEYVVGKNKEDQEAKGHPAPFPCQLSEDHILSWSNPGDIVLDPMCGSGTTGVACVNTNRDFIGIELDQGYFNIAKDRINQAVVNINKQDSLK